MLVVQRFGASFRVLRHCRVTITPRAAIANNPDKLFGIDTLIQPGIDSFILHRHVDHGHEGGLLLGLWTKKDGTVFEPDRKKLIYEVFRLADTDQWEAAFEFAKPIIGVDYGNSWNRKTFQIPIPVNSSLERPFSHALYERLGRVNKHNKQGDATDSVGGVHSAEVHRV